MEAFDHRTFPKGVNSELDLQSGMTICLTTDEAFATKSTKENLFVDYKNIVRVIQVGNRVYIDDGLISLVVKEVGESVRPRVQ
jgi:pyruvate kinase